MDKQSSRLVGSHAEGNTILYDGQSIRGWLGAMLRASLYYTMDKQSSWLVGSHAEGKTILYDGQTVLMAGWEPCWGSPISYNGQTILMAGWEPC